MRLPKLLKRSVKNYRMPYNYLLLINLKLPPEVNFIFLLKAGFHLELRRDKKRSDISDKEGLRLKSC